MHRRDKGDFDFTFQQAQLAAEIALGIEAHLFLGESAVGHHSLSEIEGGDQPRPGFLCDCHAVADMIRMAVRHQDEISFIQLG